MGRRHPLSSVFCMLHMSRKWANLWGRREGRVDRLWADLAVAWSRRAGVGHPSRQSDTPNRSRGLGPAFASVEADNGMIRIRSTRW